MKSKETRPRRRLLPLIVGAVLFLAVAVSFGIRQSEVLAAKKRLASLEQEIQHYRAINETLLDQVEMLKSGEYIEKTAREKLGLVKPGEVQYMLVTHIGE